jgi:hypothetical protein
LLFVLFRPDDGLVEGFRSGSPIKSLSLLLLAWISPAAVGVVMAKLGLTGLCPKQAQVEFNALDGGDFADRGGS